MLLSQALNLYFRINISDIKIKRHFEDSVSSLSSSMYMIELIVKIFSSAPNPPIFFSAEMKLCNIRIKNLIISSVSGIFKGFKNWQKVAEICYQLSIGSRPS